MGGPWQGCAADDGTAASRDRQKKPTGTRSTAGECDEASVMAGHTGQPEVVQSKGRQGRRRRRTGTAGRGTLAKERPPVFGMMQRGGHVVIHLLATVKQQTSKPCIKDPIVPGTLGSTDAYSMYARVCAWGYDQKSVNHGRGEDARAEDGDGLCAVPGQTMEGFGRSVGGKRPLLLGSTARRTSCNVVSRRVEAPPARCRSDRLAPRSAPAPQGSEAGRKGGAGPPPAGYPVSPASPGRASEGGVSPRDPHPAQEADVLEPKGPRRRRRPPKPLPGLPGHRHPVAHTALRRRTMGAGNGVTRPVRAGIAMRRCQPQGVW